MKQVEKHLADHPDDASAWNAKAVLQAEQEKFGPALRSLDRAIGIDPEFAAAHSNRGRVLLALGPEKAGEAILSIEKAIELNPTDLTLVRDRAACLRHLGRPEEELACYKKISEEMPNEWGVWFRMGDIELELGRFRSAIQWYDRALELEKNLAAAYIHRAIALAMLDRFKEAVKSGTTATKLEPKSVQAWLILGDVNIRAKRFKSAMKALERASELDPTDSSIDNTMGMVCYNEGRLEDAIRFLRRAVTKERNNATALRNLGLILMELEEWHDASRAFEQLTSFLKDDPDVFDAKATASAHLDDYCSAHSDWEKARKLYKNSGDEREAERVTLLGRAARINCARQKKAVKAEKEREKATRRFSDRHELRRKKSS